MLRPHSVASTYEQRHVNKKSPNGVAAAIIGASLVAIGCWTYFGDTSLRQARRMNLARQHLAAITSAVYGNPEFRNVTIGVGTAAGGCFLVAGWVENESIVSELQRFISAQQPPVNVVYQVKHAGRYGYTGDPWLSEPPPQQFTYTAKIINGQVFLSRNSQPDSMIGPFSKESDIRYICGTKLFEDMDILSRYRNGGWYYGSTSFRSATNQ